MNFVFGLPDESRAWYDVFSIMITNTWSRCGKPPGAGRLTGPAVLTGWALTAIGPTIAPRPNATATAAAQAGKRDTPLTVDQICRVTAHLHVAVGGAGPPGRGHVRALKRFSTAVLDPAPLVTRVSLAPVKPPSQR